MTVNDLIWLSVDFIHFIRFGRRERGTKEDQRDTHIEMKRREEKKGEKGRDE